MQQAGQAVTRRQQHRCRILISLYVLTSMSADGDAMVPEDCLDAKHIVKRWRKERTQLTPSSNPLLPPELWCKVMQALGHFDLLWDMRKTARDLASATLACKDMAIAAKAGWQELAKHCPEIIHFCDLEKLGPDHCRLVEDGSSNPHRPTKAGLHECCMVFGLSARGVPLHVLLLAAAHPSPNTPS